MPISGLVVALADDALGQQSADRIAAAPQIEVGRRTAHKLAVVVETASSDEDRDLWQWLRDLPGVVHVDVVFIGFDDPSQDSPAIPTASSLTSEVIS